MKRWGALSLTHWDVWIYILNSVQLGSHRFYTPSEFRKGLQWSLFDATFYRNYNIDKSHVRISSKCSDSFIGTEQQQWG